MKARRGLIGRDAPIRGAELAPWLNAYSPVCAYLFSEGVKDIVNRNNIFHGTTEISRARAGPALVTNDPSDFATLLGSDSVISTSEVTILVHFQKRDATLRAANLLGVRSSASLTYRCGMHAPFSDGTAYWDFGGATDGTTRLVVPSLTYGDDIWAFTTGPRGMQIWQNGVLRGSNTATPTRTAAVGAAWGVGMHGTTTQAPDFINLYSVILLNKQLPELELAWLTKRAWFYERAFELPSRRIFVGPSAGGGGDVSVAPSSGAISLVGYAPSLISPQLITPDAGVMSFTGLSAALSTAFKLTPDVGTLSIQGYAPSLAQNFSISPDAGVLSLLGSAPGLIQGFLLTPDTGSLALAGYAPSLGTAGSVNPSDGTLTLVGYQPGVTQQSFIVPGAGSLTITGLTPSVAGAGTLVPSEANLTLVGYQPGVTQQTFIVPGVGAISVEAHAPLLVGNTYIIPGVGAATFAGYAPSVGLGTVVSPGTGQVLLAGGTPSVITDSGSSVITPASGSLGFVGYTPTVLTAVFVTGNGRVFWLPAQSVEWVLRAQATQWVLR